MLHRSRLRTPGPLAQIVAVGLLAVAVIGVGAGVLSHRAAADQALDGARTTTRILAHSVAEPAVPRGLAIGDQGAVDRFDRAVLDRVLVGDVRRVKVWGADGTVLWSDRTPLIGERFPLGADEREVLDDGGTEAEVSDLTRPENRLEPRGTPLVEVYTRIESPEGEPLLFEAYYSLARIQAQQDSVMAPFLRVSLVALAALGVVAALLVWSLNRRLTSAAADRERLLRRAADVSLTERRRIARDLHDGVVQDLAGSAFRVSALARRVEPPAQAPLREVAGSLRGALRDLRALLVEIHPPSLRPDALPAALADLVGSAETAGLETRVEVSDDVALGDEEAELVWRVAQESVRNAVRHADARHLVVVLAGADRPRLEVSDDGHGFDPDGVDAAVHYGLRGLRGLASDRGARLDVASSSRGTTVSLEVCP